MAKQIKVIKCPHCGSVQKTEIKPDHYRCDNCSTDYFLDNDDINININHANADNEPKKTAPKNKAIIIASSILIGVIIIVTQAMMKQSKPTPQIRTATQNNLPNSSTTTRTPATQTPPEKKYQTSYQYTTTVVDGENAYILSLETRSHSYNNNQYYFVIYDLLKNKVLKETELNNIRTDKYGQLKWEYLDFSPELTYFTLNNRDVYLLNKKNYTFTNVTDNLLAQHPEYQTGIASVTRSQTTSGNALHIMTNDGKKAYYYPMIDKIYEDNNDFHMLKNRPPKPPADTSKHIIYSFANYYGQDNKLIKATFISPDGQNHFEFRSSKPGKPKLGYGVESGLEKYSDDANTAYDILNQSNLKIDLVDHKNLTAGRLYFDPSVLYFDDNTLVIKAKMNASPDADYNIQRIDVNNGNLLWNIPEDGMNVKQILPFGKQFIVKLSDNKYVLISEQGKIAKQIEITNNNNK